MKKLQIFALYDRKSKRFDTPFFTLDQIGAERHFMMIIRNKKTTVSHFKNDFRLHHIGEFDLDTGAVIVNEDEGGNVVLEGIQVQLSLFEEE